MIEHIHIQLERWARWNRVDTGPRLGYPRQAAFAGLMKGGERQSSIQPLLDDDALEIGHAVRALEPELAAVVDRMYVSMRSCSVDEMAKDLGCCRDTLYTRLHRAHLAIKEALEDGYLARIA